MFTARVFCRVRGGEEGNRKQRVGYIRTKGDNNTRQKRGEGGNYKPIDLGEGGSYIDAEYIFFFCLYIFLACISHTLTPYTPCPSFPPLPFIIYILIVTTNYYMPHRSTDDYVISSITNGVTVHCHG
jgi:hypothetical protein